jgi:hypothetical protein
MYFIAWRLPEGMIVAPRDFMKKSDVPGFPHCTVKEILSISVLQRICYYGSAVHRCIRMQSREAVFFLPSRPEEKCLGDRRIRDPMPLIGIAFRNFCDASGPISMQRREYLGFSTPHIFKKITFHLRHVDFTCAVSCDIGRSQR